MPTFSQQVLIQIVIKAARRVNRKLRLTGGPCEITIDPADGSMLTPDPDENQDLYDILLMQAECMIAQREYQTELRDGDGGVRVRDGEQEVDTRSVGIARGTFFDSDHGPCGELERCIRDMRLDGPCKADGGAGGGGKLVW